MFKVNNNDSRMMIDIRHCGVVIDKFGQIQNNFSTWIGVIANLQHMLPCWSEAVNLELDNRFPVNAKMKFDLYLWFYGQKQPFDDIL